jgi:hypothetical protein
MVFLLQSAVFHCLSQITVSLINLIADPFPFDSPCDCQVRYSLNVKTDDSHIVRPMCLTQTQDLFSLGFESVAINRLS